jgi:molecular chaperone GrpE
MTDEAPDADGVEEVPVDDVAGEESPDAAEATEVDIAARVAEYDDELAAEVRDLESRLTHLESELEAREERVEELESKLTRKQADFQNYKKRAKKKQEQVKERATEDFVERVVTVRDNLVRALDQDEDADIRPGVKSTLEEFDRILESENVEVIQPEPGAAVDPQRHEVMMRVDSDQPEGTVADVFQPGYEMADKVIRAAQITVSDGE